MIKANNVEYTEEAFDQAKSSFVLSMLSFNNILEKLEQGDYLPRYNRITILLNYKTEYSYPILWLKVFRSGSKIGEDNFYPFPLHVNDLSSESDYEIEFLHFDAFNEKFKGIQTSIMSASDYLTRQFNTNATDKAKKQIIRIDKKI